MKNENLSRDDAKQEYRHREFVTTFADGDDRQRRKPAGDRPRNALEEKYRRKAPGDRRERRRFGEERRDDNRQRRRFSDNDENRRTRRFADGENRKPEEWEHSEDFSQRVVRFRQPSISAENERPIVKGRRNAWRRKDITED